MDKNTAELLRDFKAMHAAAERYGGRYSNQVGEFGEGYTESQRPVTLAYRETLMDLWRQLEDVARELGRALGLTPEEWIDELHGPESSTWTETVAEHLKEEERCGA